MSPKRAIRCAIYTRKSTEEGLNQDFNSLDAQREACEAYVASQKSEGWVALSAPYDDGGYSGGTLDRPALQRLLRDIESGGVDVVVVYKIDRLSRSLMDFAKLVEVFDRKAVTFVSVTQSFNTTTSMGRLTLNVLLSFAQFEREITGERIRDKFAASKKKGMWMGGTPPLGYDVRDRKLVSNPVEAETIKLIFQLYLDLGNVRALRDELKSRGIVSKTWMSRTGRPHPGVQFSRGALYHLLKNRIYTGRIAHKGQSYLGEHEAILPAALFEAVQQQIENSRKHELGKPRAKHNAVLTGLLFDEAGVPMTPSYSVNPLGYRYRYYLSRYSKPGDVRITRIPAPALEYVVLEALRRLRLLRREVRQDEGLAVGNLASRVDIGSHTINIQLDRMTALRAWRSALPDSLGFTDAALLIHLRTFLSAGEELVETDAGLHLTLPVRARFRGGRASMLTPGGTDAGPAQPKQPLIRALARAHVWKKLLLSGEVYSIEEIAARFECDRSDASRILSLAFLSPALTRDILNGRHHPLLNLTHLFEAARLLSWQEQDASIKHIATAASL